MNYAQAQDIVFGFIRHKPRGIDRMRPVRMAALLEAAQFSQTFTAVHVAGTKGKGSTCAMLAAALHANGYHVGLYTSPHLIDIRERFMIDGQPISSDAFAAHVESLLPVLRSVPDVGYTEVLTLIGLTYFARCGVDIGVIETHMGGRFDPTRLITPSVSVITTLGYDHTDLLGTTLPEIAWHKAGILKAGVPAISMSQPPEAAAVLREEAESVGASLTLWQEGTDYHPLPASLEGQAVILGDGRRFETALIGQHQATNLAGVIAALDTLRDHAGLTLDDTRTQAGLRAVRWPGRLEVVRERPLVLLDGAHNPESAQALRESITALFPQRPRVLVYASKSSKDIHAVLEALLPLADHVMMTQTTDQLTSAPESLCDAAQGLSPHAPLEISPQVGDALTRALALAGESGLVLVTGSLFLVAEASRILMQESGGG